MNYLQINALYVEQVTQADVKNFFETRCGAVSMMFWCSKIFSMCIIYFSYTQCSLTSSLSTGFSSKAFGGSGALNPHCFCWVCHGMFILMSLLFLLGHMIFCFFLSLNQSLCDLVVENINHKACVPTAIAVGSLKHVGMGPSHITIFVIPVIHDLLPITLLATSRFRNIGIEFW